MFPDHAPPAIANYTDQDCRNRSFRNQQLSGVSFQRADLRGCDFRGAELVNAQFNGARLGQSLRQHRLYLLWCGSSAALTLHSMAGVLFDVLGRTPEDVYWTITCLILIAFGLGGNLALVGWVLPQDHPFLPWVRLSVSGLGSSLIVLGGMQDLGVKGISLSQQVGAVIFITTTLLILVHHCHWIVVNLWQDVVGLSLIYGFSFWLGTLSTTFLSVGSWIWGGAIAGLTWVYLVGCWYGLHTLQTKIRRLPGTLFRHAILTGAQFSQTSLQGCDFRGAVAPPGSCLSCFHPSPH